LQGARSGGMIGAVSATTGRGKGSTILAGLLAHIRGRWIGALALFLVLAGGVAYVANTTFTDDIVDGEARSADVYSLSGRGIDGTVCVTTPGGGLTAADVYSLSGRGIDGTVCVTAPTN
jgi:hypothetical protein